MLDGEFLQWSNFEISFASEPEISRIPIIVDSSKWRFIVRSFEMCAGLRGFVNSISFKNWS